MTVLFNLSSHHTGQYLNMFIKIIKLFIFPNDLYLDIGYPTFIGHIIVKSYKCHHISVS